MDVPVTIVTADEAETVDAVVCLLASDDPGVFRDNLTGTCHDCGKPVVFRPTAPWAPIRICMRCALVRSACSTA